MDVYKPTILMFPSWWPSKDNPTAGCFFKEQMGVLCEKYNFIVFCYRKKHNKLCGRSIAIKEIEDEESTDSVKMYSCIFSEPIYTFFIKFLNIVKVKLHRIKLDDGIGEYSSEKDLQYLTKCLKKYFKKNCHEINLIYGLSAQDECVPVYCAARALNVSYVLAEHAPFPWPGSTISNLQKICFENADAHLLISHDKLRQIMLQNIKLKNVNYVGNFVDESMFKFEPVEHGKTTFIIVAANSFYKNYDMFIAAMNRLSEIATKDFAVVVAGFGANKGYSKNVDELIQKIKSSKFADKAELVPFVPRSEMSALLNRCDAFVMTSIQEGQPVSAMEAGCCGLPLFSTRCGGVEDYVTDDIGRIVPVNDSEQLANYLNDFLEGRISFDKKHIRNFIVSKFGHDAFIKNVSDVFDGLIK